MKTSTNFSYFAQFCLKWEMLQTSYIENQSKICVNIFFFRKSCQLRSNVEKYGRAELTANGNKIWRMRIACWIPNAANTHSQ